MIQPHQASPTVVTENLPGESPRTLLVTEGKGHWQPPDSHSDLIMTRPQATSDNKVVPQSERWTLGDLVKLISHRYKCKLLV